MYPAVLAQCASSAPVLRQRADAGRAFSGHAAGAFLILSCQWDATPGLRFCRSLSTVQTTRLASGLGCPPFVGKACCWPGQLATLPDRHEGRSQEALQWRPRAENLRHVAEEVPPLPHSRDQPDSPKQTALVDALQSGQSLDG